MAFNESYKRWHTPKRNNFNEDGTRKKGKVIKDIIKSLIGTNMSEIRTLLFFVVPGNFLFVNGVIILLLLLDGDRSL